MYETDSSLCFPATAISVRRRQFLHTWAFLVHDRSSLASHDLGICCPLESDIRIRWNSKSEITLHPTDQKRNPSHAGKMWTWRYQMTWILKWGRKISGSMISSLPISWKITYPRSFSTPIFSLRNAEKAFEYPLFFSGCRLARPVIRSWKPAEYRRSQLVIRSKWPSLFVLSSQRW